MTCFFYADTDDDLLDTRDEILARLESVGLFVAAHKCTLFSHEIVWCGKVYSHWRVSHDPVRLQGLSDMRRPETCLLYTSPSPRDLSTSRMPSSA